MHVCMRQTGSDLLLSLFLAVNKVVNGLAVRSPRLDLSQCCREILPNVVVDIMKGMLPYIIIQLNSDTLGPLHREVVLDSEVKALNKGRSLIQRLNTVNKGHRQFIGIDYSLFTSFFHLPLTTFTIDASCLGTTVSNMP